MRADQIAGMIFVRDQHAYVRYSYALRVLACALLLLAFSVATNAVLLRDRDQYRYLMTDAIGDLMPLVPMSEANMGEDDVGRWATDAITRVYTFDFVNFRQQFTAAQQLLTGIGWEGFADSLRKSGNFVSITENGYVATAVPSGPVHVTSIGPAKGADGSVRFVWHVTLPMLITYRSSKQTTSMDVTVESTVVRMPEFVNRQGLGIRQLILR